MHSETTKPGVFISCSMQEKRSLERHLAHNGSMSRPLEMLSGILAPGEKKFS
jgi:hypothetical protein